MAFKNFVHLLLIWKFLPYKLEERTWISQQFLLNLDIGCKNYNTSNGNSKLCEDTFGPLGYLGVKASEVTIYLIVLVVRGISLPSKLVTIQNFIFL